MTAGGCLASYTARLQRAGRERLGWQDMVFAGHAWEIARGACATLGGFATE